MKKYMIFCCALFTWSVGGNSLNPHNLRKDFPFFSRKNSPVYFDNAATTHKPKQVIDAVVDFYTFHNANVGRGIYDTAEQATNLYEGARLKIAHFIGALPEEIIFTSGATQGVNFIARTWGETALHEGDEILITPLEHHANLIPWQQLAHRKKLKLNYIPLNSDGTLNLEVLPRLLSEKTKLVAIGHVSNALGVTNRIDTIIRQARAVGARVLIDAAQSVSRHKLNVHELDCDFLVFSGHKMVGPTGVGVLYIKKSLHKKISPYEFGGSMAACVDRLTSTWEDPPEKYEAGTPPIAQAVGLGAAVDYLASHVDFEALHKHESALCKRVIEGLEKLSFIRMLGPIEELKKSGHSISFVVDGLDSFEVAEYLNDHNICVRAGRHCAYPLAKKTLGYPGSVRVSFYFYNTPQEVDYFLDVISQLKHDHAGT